MQGCRPLTDTEIVIVRQRLSASRWGTRDLALFILREYTGLRISEALGLDLGDVWSSGRVVDRIALAPAVTKGGQSGASIVLHSDARAAMSAWIAVRGTMAGPLFISQKGGRLGRIAGWRSFKEAARAAGIADVDIPRRVATHSVRKTFADRIFSYFESSRSVGVAGAENSLRATSKALRHQGQWALSNTIRYLSFKDDSVDNAILAARHR